jgi:hypothetical protein
MMIWFFMEIVVMGVRREISLVSLVCWGLKIVGL